MKRTQILLTNDDGIDSPGLWAAARALSRLGFVTVAAPRDQASSTGRSMPLTSDGRILSKVLHIGEQDWQVYAVGGTPAQVVQHMVWEVLPEKPDLVVSGINYGENVGVNITISGTVGAALEAASSGIPAMAVSLQVHPRYYYTHSDEIDFGTAAHFTYVFAKRLLELKMPEDVDVLNVNVPFDADEDTPWTVSRLSRQTYYIPVFNRSGGTFEDPCEITARLDISIDDLIPETDVHALIKEHKVSVAPLSLDMTSRVKQQAFDQLLRSGDVD